MSSVRVRYRLPVWSNTLNPFAYCTMVECSDREWENMGEVGVVMLVLLIVVGVIGGIVSWFNKDKGD